MTGNFPQQEQVFFLHLDKAANADFYSNCRLRLAFL